MAFQPQTEYTGAGSYPPPTPISSSAMSSMSSSAIPSSLTERKSSLVVSNGGFVSPTNEWHDISIEGKHVADGMNDLALGPGASMDGSHFKAEQSWSPPAQGYSQPGDFDPLITEYGAGGGPNGMSLQFDHSQTGPPPTGGMPAMPNPAPFPMSPQSQSWMTGEGYEFSPLAPQSTRQTPVFATSTHILRRDGIRKKNARFDIPAERNLRTIDQLIAQTADESEIKELKQQKRLLRNRQAALDSRQRKKQHTERLEEEKKQYTNIISDLEEKYDINETQWQQRQNDWRQQQAQMQQWITQLQLEKEQAIAHYSSDLNETRRQNAVLLQQLQKDSASMSASGSTGMPSDFTDFEQLTIQSNHWETYPVQNDFSLESDNGSEHAMAGPTKTGNAVVNKDDKNSASGLLLMLLLCGAWVVSRGSSDTKEILPTMPDDLRVASATVIEDLYKGSGIHLPETDDTQNSLVMTGQMHNHQQRPTGSFDTAMGPYTMSNGHGLAQSQQDAFPSSTANVQSTGNMLRDAMRSVNAQNPPAAETYTKSLLMDKVPNQVLKDFAQMIAQNRPLKHDVSIPAQLPNPTYD